MDESTRQEALFRYTVLGTLLARVLERGELKRGLEERAAQTWVDAKGRRRTIAAKTLEEWFYKYQRHGFDGLMPAPRNDRGKIRCLSPDAQELIIAMKREDPGRSAALIARELIGAGILERGCGHLSAIRRLLKNEGLSGPCFELERPERRRWQATTCGELWQGDALHGPALHDPSAGRKVRVKVRGKYVRVQVSVLPESGITDPSPKRRRGVLVRRGRGPRRLRPGLGPGMYPQS